MALTCRNRLFGSPPEAAFSASIAWATAETMISCITSVADFAIARLKLVDAANSCSAPKLVTPIGGKREGGPQDIERLPVVALG